MGSLPIIRKKWRHLGLLSIAAVALFALVACGGAEEPASARTGTRGNHRTCGSCACTRTRRNYGTRGSGAHGTGRACSDRRARACDGW